MVWYGYNGSCWQRRTRCGGFFSCFFPFSFWLVHLLVVSTLLCINWLHGFSSCLARICDTMRSILIEGLFFFPALLHLLFTILIAFTPCSTWLERFVSHDPLVAQVSSDGCGKLPPSTFVMCIMR
ncbi:hypothetical protein B0I35DRAFT_141848 [Stachybotrys elegans]|uniref:Uncharacterized protein n=1 Tax=Stachybotrys elegans TaxID=80388 RepID=A0A8K0T1F9_9HYPO|nr:hypothetical protein B0I35DRAFT_141848 [Stachybotrys elegans]